MVLFGNLPWHFRKALYYEKYINFNVINFWTYIQQEKKLDVQ